MSSKTPTIHSKIIYKIRKALIDYIIRISNSNIQTHLKLIIIDIFLNKHYNTPAIGSLWNKPSPISKRASTLATKYNVNNLGNTYTNRNHHQPLHKQIEHQTIEQVKKLFKASNSTIEGYITSGGTEANLLLSWLGKQWLGNKTKIMITTDFTHYSIKKAAKILDIPLATAATNTHHWNIDSKSLTNVFETHIKKGVKHFLLPLTLGYSSIGTLDSLENSIDIVQILTKKYSIKVFIWIDAASMGLPLSYLKKDFKPFMSPIIQGMVIDFHKFGQTPIPSGMVLYRKNLRKLIQTPIDYLEEDDVTISGSRPGSSAFSIWANLNSLQMHWSQEFTRLHELKKDFIQEIKQFFPQSTVITSENSLICAIAINKHFPSLPKTIENKYSLNIATVKYLDSSTNKYKSLKHYKIYFLPNSKLDPKSFVSLIKSYQ